MLAAVCHEGGQTVHAGHYVAYALDGGALLRFDDLSKSSRVGRAGGLEDATAVLFRDVARDAYFLLYEVVEDGDPAAAGERTQAFADRRLAEAMQAHELLDPANESSSCTAF